MRPTDEGEAVTGKAKNCAQCGRSFLCGADEVSCWCDEIRLTDEQRASLAARRLIGCLCRRCLEGLAAAHRAV